MKTGQIQTQFTRNKSCENLEEQELKFKSLENTFAQEGKYIRKSKRSQTEKALKKMTYASVLKQGQKQAFSLAQLEINEREHQNHCQELSKTTNNNKQTHQDSTDKKQVKLWSQKGALSKPKGLGIDQQIINISNTDYLERHFPKLAVEKEKQLFMQLKENNKDLPKKLKNKFYQDVKVENQDAQKKIQTVYNIHQDYWKDPYSSD